MLLRFFETLREFRVPISTRELLDLLAVMQRGMGFADRDAFYFLARLCLVKDERFFDRFDRAFKFFFDAIGNMEGMFDELLPAERIAELARQLEGPAEQSVREAQVARLIADYRAQLAAHKANAAANHTEQARQEFGVDANDDASDHDHDKHQDDDNRTDAEENADDDEGDDGEGNEGEHGEAGTGEAGEGEDGNDGEEGNDGEGEEGDDGEGGEGKRGDGEVGADGEHDEGTRKDQDRSRHRVASRVWEERLFADLDDDVELGTRTFKIALRRLRKFARIGAEEELDIADTIASTAKNGGILDIRMVPERRNNVKVLLFLDIGGSMDDHVQVCEQLFSAARSEFKYLVEFYFHNFVYDHVWSAAARKDEHKQVLIDVTRKYGRDCKVVFVGDSNMGLHEITERGGCIERYNEEPGAKWFDLLTAHFKRVVWINPLPIEQWSSTFSTVRVQRMIGDHMYPLTNDGLTGAMRALAK